MFFGRRSKFMKDDAIDNRIVWGIVEEDLDNLIADIERLLR